MPHLFSRSALVALLLTLTRFAQAITYYISPTGNDNAAGTSATSAWQSIAKLNSINLLPGTIVLFEGGQSFPGTINLNSSDGNDPLNPILISSYGTGKAVIQSGAGMGCYAYNTKGFKISDLVFEGSGMYANLTDGVKIHTDLGGDIKLENITVSNVEIRNYGVVGLYIYSSNYNTGFKDLLVDHVHIYNVRENGLFVKGYTSPTHVGWSHQNITIRNTEVNEVPGYADASTHRGSGIIMAQVDNGLIENSVAHHNGAANTHCGGPGGIWAYDCNNVTIQRCESFRNSSGSGCDGLGFDFDGGMTNSLMQYNYSHDNDGAGYLLGQYEYARPWSNNVVRYNISENDGRTNSSGITLFKAANATMNGCKIYHNTVYSSPSTSNTGVGAFAMTEWNTGINGVEVYNNIFQTAGGAYLVNIPTGYEATLAGNLYWSTGGTFKIRYHGINYSSVSAWRSASGYETVGSLQTGITADPLLLNAGASTIVWPSPTASLAAYTFNANSPAINTGLNLNALFAINSGSVDYFNTALPANNLRDIGAYERPVPTVVTSLQEINTAENNLRFFPNPVSPGEDIALEGGEGAYLVELYSINGSLVLQQSVEGDRFHLPEGVLTNGIYVIRLSDKKGRVASSKLIVR